MQLKGKEQLEELGKHLTQINWTKVISEGTLQQSQYVNLNETKKEEKKTNLSENKFVGKTKLFD